MAWATLQPDAATSRSRRQPRQAYGELKFRTPGFSGSPQIGIHASMDAVCTGDSVAFRAKIGMHGNPFRSSSVPIELHILWLWMDLNVLVCIKLLAFRSIRAHFHAHQIK